MTEEQRARHKEAKKKYKAKVKRLSIDFYPTEKDLLEQLEKQPNKQGYIKNLIRQDMQKKGHNVFVVTAGCYSDYHIQAIFDDLEQAQIYCAINSGCNEDIEIYNTKEAVLNTDKTVKKTWFAVIGEKGKIHSLRFQYSLLQIDSVAKIDRSYENFENHKWKYGYFDDFVVYEIKATLDKEITEDKAKKIIFDRLTKWKAEHLETI